MPRGFASSAEHSFFKRAFWSLSNVYRTRVLMTSAYANLRVRKRGKRGTKKEFRIIKNHKTRSTSRRKQPGKIGIDDYHTVVDGKLRRE